jgi:hypothetical protein
MTIPSLMFFMRASGANKITSFLKQITKDWLFLLQLILLLLLIGVLGEPFTFYNHDVTASNTVLVIDVSASMQVKEGLSTRFQKAISKAKSSLGVTNSIILAKHVPFIGLKEGTPMDAQELLNSLSPTESPTKLGDSILLAGEVLSGKEGRVIVFSDFINTAGQDPDTAKSVLETRGYVVDFVNVAETDDIFNIGFVDADVTDESVTAYIKNFDKEEHKVRLASPTFSKDIVLPGLGVEPFSFSTSPGETRLVLQTDDNFAPDNVLRVSAPDKLNVSVLLITNNRSVFLANALTAGGGVNLKVAVPPIVPEGNFDVYILHDIKYDEVLSGTFEKIYDKVKDGASVIVHGQENMKSTHYAGLVNGEVIGVGDASEVQVEQLTRFTKSLDFGSVGHYPILEIKDSSNILTAEGNPVLSLSSIGNGKALFFGILESASDFKFAPDYPVFWVELMRFVTQKADIKSLNYDTSQTMILDRRERIVTPSGKNKGKQSIAVLDEAGFYHVGERTVAVNLLNERESSLSSAESVGQKSKEYELKPVTEKRKYSFDLALLVLALLFLAGEVLYVKMRGEV